MAVTRLEKPHKRWSGFVIQIPFWSLCNVEAAGGRFPANQFLPYIVAQVVGGVIGGAVLYNIASGKAGFDLTGGHRKLNG